jgi:shikimate kinase
MHDPIFLVGMPASGKSTLGKKIAKALNLSFVDLDKHIEQSEKMSISSLFNKKGENHFREMERYYLRSVIQKEKGLIMSTGGGTACFFDNMEYMNMQGITLYLKAELSILIERNTKNKRFRPLFNNSNNEDIARKISQMLHERGPYYEKSKIWLCDETLINKTYGIDNQLFTKLNHVISTNVNFK